VFIRADLNVPVKEGKVTSDARITASMPTIEHAVKAGAKVEMILCVIVIGVLRYIKESKRIASLLPLNTVLKRDNIPQGDEREAQSQWRGRRRGWRKEKEEEENYRICRIFKHFFRVNLNFLKQNKN